MTVINIPLSRYIRRKIKKLWTLPVVAKQFDLSIVKQENLRGQLIGLDLVRRKLLLVKKVKDRFDCYIVDLQQVKHCSVKKVYSSIRAGELQTNGLAHYLRSITLQLGFRSGDKPFTVTFYESQSNTIKQQTFLEKAAKKWEQFVSELLAKPAPVALG